MSGNLAEDWSIHFLERINEQIDELKSDKSTFFKNWLLGFNFTASIAPPHLPSLFSLNIIFPFVILIIM